MGPCSFGDLIHFEHRLLKNENLNESLEKIIQEKQISKQNSYSKEMEPDFREDEDPPQESRNLSPNFEEINKTPTHEPSILDPKMGIQDFVTTGTGKLNL